MLYRDCTGKKVVPTIARGVKLGEGGESLTPHFRHGAKSSAGPAALPGISDSRRENTDPNEVFEHQLSLLRRSDKKFVKKTGDRPSLYTVRDSRSTHWVICRGSPSISWPSGNVIANHCGLTPALYDTERFLPYSER
jgi:hypothetical protein